ncbi:hypothetical protein ALO95_102161 [Pseudomonas syringae pv. antirrhini]|uniref:Uncharacterized protein n=3 Tax=Pseudomonas syringae group TaxID=136849 RepID=A0A3M4TYK7_9PSED|nr:hypothetical protein ALO88_102554 [Pseudomonas syringae pv. antirrhini]KPX76339.1 hypothetical protein ALO84_102124 [Pseudomonas syringae pv. maculicola]KPY12754.1 hypothetical protein ALO54_102348 [Pseudomonas syringae pv. philadelphi]KPY91938.1 hypothetical protein ALO36_103748 [Pseudomonas syringae pv. tomato]RMM13902.1 hypothetical protein ALQ85_102410 [Pseudomonas syringae]RMM20010.1 hypothetical protein ALQ83_102398 [Pseudomonas syringae pv. berberidis]RMO85805.1 hypothetical protein
MSFPEKTWRGVQASAGCVRTRKCRRRMDDVPVRRLKWLELLRDARKPAIGLV